MNRAFFTRRSFTLGVMGAAIAVASPATASDTIVNPDVAALYFLQHQAAGIAPDFVALTAFSESLRRADEFHRKEEYAKAEAALRAKAASVVGVKTLTVNLQTQFGEYDNINGEYDIDINDGSYIPYGRVFERDIRLALTNGTDAQVWRLPAETAAAVLARNGGFRNLRLVLRLEVLASPPTVHDDPIVLNTRIREYDVLAPNRSNARLGHVVVGEGG